MAHDWILPLKKIHEVAVDKGVNRNCLSGESSGPILVPGYRMVKVCPIPSF